MISRLLLYVLLLGIPGYSQIPTPTPSNLTLNNATITGTLTAPSIKLGNGAYTLILPPTPPKPGNLLGVKSATGTTAQAQWVTGFSGTRKAGTCILTIQNGLITAVTGC